MNSFLEEDRGFAASRFQLALNWTVIRLGWQLDLGPSWAKVQLRDPSRC
jgi:hypothetical protein